MYKNLKIGIALGGGAARGLAHIGVLKELKREGISVDAVAGTSMGAIIGGYYSVFPDIKKLEEDLSDFVKRGDFRNKKLEFLKRKKNDNAFVRSMSNFFKRGVYFGSSLFSSSFIPIEEFTSNIDSIIPDLDIKDLSLEFAALAVDLSNSRKKVFLEGSLRKALMASSAIPGLFPPIEIDGKKYIDGGWAEIIPLSPLQHLNCDFIIAVDVSYDSIEEGPFEKGLDIMTRSARIKSRSMANLCVKDADLVVKVFVEDIDWTDFDRIDELIIRGEKAIKERKDELHALLKRKRLKKMIPFRKYMEKLIR